MRKRRRVLSVSILIAAVLWFAVTVGVFIVRRQTTRSAGAPDPQPAAAPLSSGAAGSGGPMGSGSAATDPAAAPAPFATAPEGVRAEGEVVVRGRWGGGPGQFGRRREAESSPEGPMALHAGRAGELLILDQVNRRVERYKDGTRTGSLAMGGDTLQDLAVGAEGRVALLDRFVDKSVQIYSADGKLQNEVGLTGPGVPEPGHVTGVFADEDGVYVEREHGSVVRIADGSGATDPARSELPGRPSRDGALFIAAALLDRAAGTVVVRAFTRATQKPAWERSVQLEAPVVQILMLDSDRQGRVYLAATIGHEDPKPPYKLVDESITAVRLGTGGVERGRLRLPPLPDVEESVRPLSVDDAGDLYLMATRPEGLEIRRYRFP